MDQNKKMFILQGEKLFKHKKNVTSTMRMGDIQVMGEEE